MTFWDFVIVTNHYFITMIPAKAYLRKKSLTQFEEVPEEEGKHLCNPDHDWIRVVYLASFCNPKEDDKVLIFLHTTNLRDVCRYLGTKTSHAPHYYDIELVEGDKILHLNPYGSSIDEVAPKGSTIFVRQTHIISPRACGHHKLKCSWEELIAQYNDS